MLSVYVRFIRKIENEFMFLSDHFIRRGNRINPYKRCSDGTIWKCFLSDSYISISTLIFAVRITGIDIDIGPLYICVGQIDQITGILYKRHWY